MGWQQVKVWIAVTTGYHTEYEGIARDRETAKKFVNAPCAKETWDDDPWGDEKIMVSECNWGCHRVFETEV